MDETGTAFVNTCYLWGMEKHSMRLTLMNTGAAEAHQDGALAI